MTDAVLQAYPATLFLTRGSNAAATALRLEPGRCARPTRTAARPAERLRPAGGRLTRCGGALARRNRWRTRSDHPRDDRRGVAILDYDDGKVTSSWSTLDPPGSPAADAPASHLIGTTAMAHSPTTAKRGGRPELGRLRRRLRQRRSPDLFVTPRPPGALSQQWRRAPSPMSRERSPASSPREQRRAFLDFDATAVWIEPHSAHGTRMTASAGSRGLLERPAERAAEGPAGRTTLFGNAMALSDVSGRRASEGGPAFASCSSSTTTTTAASTSTSRTTPAVWLPFTTP